MTILAGYFYKGVINFVLTYKYSAGAMISIRDHPPKLSGAVKSREIETFAFLYQFCVEK